jgi:hypothetical protein
MKAVERVRISKEKLERQKGTGLWQGRISLNSIVVDFSHPHRNRMGLPFNQAVESHPSG